jgi:hypothetical protein
MCVELTVFKQVATWFRAELERTTKKRQEDWIVECLADASKVSTAVAVSLLSIALGREPLDDEVQALLHDIMGSPAAPARIRRLLEEMFRSPSPRRRARLAAVFAGRPIIVDNPDQRDRLDILAAILRRRNCSTRPFKLVSVLYRRPRSRSVAQRGARILTVRAHAEGTCRATLPCS